jgi:archaellum component FlaC
MGNHNSREERRKLMVALHRIHYLECRVKRMSMLVTSIARDLEVCVEDHADSIKHLQDNERDCVEKLQELVAEVEAKLSEVYNAPGMPGYHKAAGSYIDAQFEDAKE